MDYPQTGNEVYISFSLSNTMFTGIGKGTITREDVSADYLKDLFQKYGVIVSAKAKNLDAEYQRKAGSLTGRAKVGNILAKVGFPLGWGMTGFYVLYTIILIAAMA